MSTSKFFLKSMIKDCIAPRSNSKQRIITACILCLLFYSIFFLCPLIISSSFICLLMMAMLWELKNILQLTSSFFCVAIFYPIIPCLMLINLNQDLQQRHLVIYLFVLVALFDTGSYVSGKGAHRWWTTHKIIPKISPGKSWEGFFGGILCTQIVLCMLYTAQGQYISWQAIICMIPICIIAFAGDMFESYLKRSANIKDSGNLLPGHGGLLDRFDGILAVTYFFYIYQDYLAIILQ